MLFFHVTVARMVLTCSGSFMLHSLDSAFSLVVAVTIVDSALPSFLSCHAWLSMLSSFGAGWFSIILVV